MVSALRFKGDPKTKSKKRKSTSDPSSVPSSSRPRLSPNPTSSESTSAWCLATNTADLAASPITFIASSHFLSADLAGRIFASPCTPPSTSTLTSDDGQIPGSSSGFASAVPEPQTVQQVFEAKPIYGSDLTPIRGKFSIRSHGQRYLASDKFGAMGCESEAIGEREVWVMERVGEGWEVRGWKGILGAVSTKEGKGIEVRADYKNEEVVGVPDEGEGEGREVAKVEEMPAMTWMVCCQSRFKTRDVGEGEEGGKAGKVVKERIGKRELERLVGRNLEEEEVRGLKKAKREGRLNEALLDVRAKSRRDKFAF